VRAAGCTVRHGDLQCSVGALVVLLVVLVLQVMVVLVMVVLVVVHWGV